MESDKMRATHKTVARSTYALVFLVLVVVTAVEVGLSSVSLPRAVLNVLFISLSFTKAALVAAFYMHLRYERRLYTYVFILPAVLLGIFTYLTLLS